MLLASLLALASFGPGDPPTPDDIVSALETATIRAIERARPSVVAIARVRGDEPDKTTAILGEPPAVNVPLGPENDPEKPLRFNYAAPGDFSSGVVIGPGKAIVTTYHTLRGSAQIWVRTADRQEFEAVIIAADPRSDLAVIVPREGTAPMPKLTPMAVGDATKLRPGSFLIAMGNPYNAARDGKASAGWGILANTARRFHTPTDTDRPNIRPQFFLYQPTLLQLDAKLNLGMSGGAVVNMKGELVGLTTAAASPVAYDVQAGYAIPMDALGLRVIAALRLGMEAEYGFLGVQLDLDVRKPNTVKSVEGGTPADKADLVAGDEIVAVGGRNLDGEDALTMALAAVPVGEEVTITIRRGNQMLDKTILVSKYPINGQVIATTKSTPWRGLRIDFASILANQLVPGFNALSPMSFGGVVVVEVDPGSSADRAGIKKKQIITEINGRPVPTPAAFAKAAAAAEAKDAILTLPQIGGFGEGSKVTLPK